MNTAMAIIQSAMPPFSMMLFMFFLAFAFQNKAPFLYGRSAFTDRLLHCTYCLGTHCGWITWLLAVGLAGQWLMPTWWQNVICALIWAGCGAAFSYALDTVIRWLESHTIAVAEEEEEVE